MEAAKPSPADCDHKDVCAVNDETIDKRENVGFASHLLSIHQIPCTIVSAQRERTNVKKMEKM